VVGVNVGLLLILGLFATPDAGAPSAADAGPSDAATRAADELPELAVPSPREFASDTDALVESLERSQTQDAGFSLLYVLSITLVIVLGIFLLRHLLLRIPALHKHRAQNITIESQLAIDPKNRLIIARVEGRRILLGVSDSGGIGLLRELPDQTEDEPG
jgi:flagellar biogenesis protein FliO